MGWFSGLLDFGKNIAGDLLGFGGNVAGTMLGNQANIEAQREAQAFNHAEGELGRDWQEERFEDAMHFNSAQRIASQRYDRTAARIAFDRSKELRSTQYQTAVEDMKKAGLNPMLAYSQGGAGTPSVSSPSSRGASIGGAGGATTGHITQSHLEGYGNAVGTAVGTARMVQEVKNLQEQQRLIGAQVAQTEALTAKAKQETITGTYSAQNLYASTAELKQKIRNMRAQLPLVTQQVYETHGRNLVHAADVLLKDAERALKGKEQGKVAAQTLVEQAEFVLKKLQVPEAVAMARAWNTEYGQKVMPFTGELIKGLGSAAAVKSLITPKFKGPTTVHKHFHRGP